jgi:hypothetical protein
MTYVFPLYWRPAFLVYLPGEYANYHMIVCLLVNGASSKILSYSITFGDPIINVFRTSLAKCDDSLLFAAVRALQPNYKNHIIRLDNDSLKVSLTSTRRSRSPFSSVFERRWLRSFYDWHRHELEHVADPYRIMLGTLKQMLERAICRMNEETLAQAV